MTVREMKHAALAEQWTANIIDCRQSGLSVAAWCEEHQVNKSTYDATNKTVGSRTVTVTITPKPDEGYAVNQIIVTDASGNPVEVTDNGDGTYSFKQPSGKVTVTVTFQEKTRVVFVDVPANAYYYDAVYWAVEHGITNGTSDTTFSPDESCTRAQIVTFLYRYLK